MSISKPATDKSRGQALVEFALILPLLVLLLVLAVDFGRAFFGWVALTNVVRIGANEAAFNPDAWEGAGDATKQNLYRQQMINDMTAIGCRPPGSPPGTAWATADVPNPSFEDQGGTADVYEIGDHAVVEMSCGFSFITPLVSIIMGDPMPISARAEFPVKGGEIAGVPTGPEPENQDSCLDALIPNMVGMSVAGARDQWQDRGFTGSFSPSPGDDDYETVLAQYPTPYAPPGSCAPLWTTVVVTVEDDDDDACTAPDLEVPNLIGLTVGDARDVWQDRGFTGSFSPSSGAGKDSELVDNQTTSPSAPIHSCMDPGTSITVTHSPPPPPPPTYCRMPQLIGQKVNDASSTFTTSGFTTTLNVTRPPQGNYNVTSQSLVGGQYYPCSSTATVAGN